VPLQLAFAFVAIVGALAAGGSWLALRGAGAQPALARRLAGPREVKVGRLLDAEDLPRRPVRVAGRVRCRDPLDTGDEQLVAFHRDVEVLVGGRWRSVERLREARSFELWDHDGSLTVDPALAADPLVTIPKVWRGDPSALEEPHASAVARLAERHGPATAARSTVRTLTITDRLLVVARPTRHEDERVRLDPPPGGFVISNLALDDAMRLLGGGRRRVVALSVVGIGLGVALVVVGVAGMVLGTLL
jgi:hypothetical protein